MSETILIVDDEESIRQTFQEWLTSSGMGLNVFVAADAESALRIANEREIDLAILDWNLGSGSDGLRLLEDLVEFRPDIVAILITGFAHVATPLEALRMGVRDYLDKNADLNRDVFLRAVRRQLDRIRPARRERELSRVAVAFRTAVEQILPAVRTAAVFNDPVPLPEAVKSLVRFVIQATGASDGALLIRHLSAEGVETTQAFGASGETLPVPTVPFARSLAASVASHQEPMVVNGVDVGSHGGVELLAFERGRSSILAAPLPVGGTATVVIELFDKPAPGFTVGDRQLAAAAAAIGADLLRQALAERQTNRMLFEAVDAALQATSDMTATTDEPTAPALPTLPTLPADASPWSDDENTRKLVEAVRDLASLHGPAAVKHCVRVVNDVRQLLDGMTGSA